MRALTAVNGVCEKLFFFAVIFEKCVLRIGSEKNASSKNYLEQN